MALTLTNTDNVDDSEGTNFELASVFGVTTAVVGGRTLLFTAAQDDNGISVFELAADGTLTSVRDEPDRGDLELLGASSVATADIGGQVFLFAASLDDGGMSSFAVLGNGVLLNTDNEDDATDPAFELGGALAVTTAVADGRTFAFVAGFSDDGVSVFEVSVEGALIHRDSVDDAIDAPQELDGARGLATAVIGGTTYLYVAGALDNGISVFEFDPTIPSRS